MPTHTGTYGRPRRPRPFCVDWDRGFSEGLVAVLSPSAGSVWTRRVQTAQAQSCAKKMPFVEVAPHCAVVSRNPGWGAYLDRAQFGSCAVPTAQGPNKPPNRDPRNYSTMRRGFNYGHFRKKYTRFSFGRNRIIRAPPPKVRGSSNLPTVLTYLLVVVAK